jgi:HD-like signal output (HDOD) protein
MPKHIDRSRPESALKSRIQTEINNQLRASCHRGRYGIVVNTNAAIPIEQLTTRPLPIFGHSARAFRKLHSANGSLFERYGDIILKDPGLALHTLQQLHAATSKPLQTEISSMAQATMLLGMERVKQLPQGLPELEDTLQGRARTGFTRASCRAFHAAFQAWDWAHIKDEHAPEEILLAALLHDVAEMALWVVVPDKMHLMRKLIFKDRLHTDEAQYIALGESLEHFSREIAARWQLPSLVHDALRPENARNPRVHGVMLAVQLGRAAERGWHTEKMHSTLELIAAHLGTPLDETVNHVHKTAVRAARETNFYATRPAAALLPLLPGDDEILIEDEFPEAETKIETRIQVSPEVVMPTKPAAAPKLIVKAAPEREKEPALVTTVTVPTEICLTPQYAIFEQTLRDLRASMGNLGLNDTMRTVVHGLHDGIGLNRVVFAMLTLDRKKLTSRYIIGADNDSRFSRFEIYLDKPHLFTQLLEKPVSLWVNDDNRAKYWPQVPDDFKTLIKTNAFFTTSIHLRGKPIGLFYADRRSVACTLDDHAYQQFCQLCELATKGLEHYASDKPTKG